MSISPQRRKGRREIENIFSTEDTMANEFKNVGRGFSLAFETNK